MSQNEEFQATADSIINECCGQHMFLEDYDLLEKRIVSAINHGYKQGQHAERKRTAQLIGKVRIGCGVGGNTALDRLIMEIASKELPL